MARRKRKKQYERSERKRKDVKGGRRKYEKKERKKVPKKKREREMEQDRNMTQRGKGENRRNKTNIDEEKIVKRDLKIRFEERD